MTDRLELALERLKRVAEKAESEGSGMDIPDIIEAVVGPDYDKELEGLVSIALESSGKGMGLTEIASGVMRLHDWRDENT